MKGSTLAQAVGVTFLFVHGILVLCPMPESVSHMSHELAFVAECAGCSGKTRMLSTACGPLFAQDETNSGGARGGRANLSLRSLLAGVPYHAVLRWARDGLVRAHGYHPNSISARRRRSSSRSRRASS